MHYTAMYEWELVQLQGPSQHHAEGLAASQQILAVVVAVLCFVIAAGFLLSLVPDPRRQTITVAEINPVAEAAGAAARTPLPEPGPIIFPRVMSAPLRGLGH